MIQAGVFAFFGSCLIVTILAKADIKRRRTYLLLRMDELSKTISDCLSAMARCPVQDEHRDSVLENWFSTASIAMTELMDMRYEYVNEAVSIRLAGALYAAHTHVNVILEGVKLHPVFFALVRQYKERLDVAYRFEKARQAVEFKSL